MKQNENGKHIEPIDLSKDPLNVFSMVQEDNEPAIRISGEVLGILATDEEYENYHLKLGFKWGDEKFHLNYTVKRIVAYYILYPSVGKEAA